MPHHILEQVWTIMQHLGKTHGPALALGLLALAILILWPKKWQAVPASIVAVIVPTIVVVAMHPSVQTIGTKFGGIPSGFPALDVPHFSFAQIQELIAPPLTIAVLGAIESLLSAMVADGMIETRHDSNQELIGQGLANIVTPFFGGSATGAIARTATNICSGGKHRSPASFIPLRC